MHETFSEQNYQLKLLPDWTLTAIYIISSKNCILLSVAIKWACIFDDSNIESMWFFFADIIKAFNPDVYGFSYGRGGRNSENAMFNCAVPGAVSE